MRKKDETHRNRDDHPDSVSLGREQKVEIDNQKVLDVSWKSSTTKPDGNFDISGRK